LCTYGAPKFVYILPYPALRRLRRLAQGYQCFTPPACFYIYIFLNFSFLLDVLYFYISITCYSEKYIVYLQKKAVMSIFKYKNTGRIGLFDKEETSSKLSKLGNPLEKLHKVIDFEIFRPELEDNMLNHEKKNNAGCKPYDVVMMFKIILLKRFYNLSDEQAEYQITDRLSFRELLCKARAIKLV
jgi:hypothetical protein